MTTDCIGLISILLRYAGREIAADGLAPSAALSPFVRAGWIVPAGVPATVVCTVCDDVHFVDVALVDGKPQGICTRTGDCVPVATELYYVHGDAFARALALGFHLDGDVRNIRGFNNFWMLGGRRIGDTRVVFFFTPNLDNFHEANSVLDAFSKQSGAMTSGLIVASDRQEQIRLLTQRHRVLFLREIAKIDEGGSLIIDEPQLFRSVLPEGARPNPSGRRPEKRDRILPILNALVDEDAKIAGLSLIDREIPNETCRLVRRRYLEQFPNNQPPRPSTIRDAIKAWKTVRDK